MIALSLLLSLALAAWLFRGYAPWPLVRALLWRYRAANALFVGLIAVALAMGIAVIAQERGLREGSARAAAPFDVVVGAPGSEMTLMLASVYLQPSRVPLLDGAQFARIAEDPRVALAAPLAFGDSHDGAPVVGTLAGFVEHLAQGGLQGRLFATAEEAVVGALSDLEVGDHFHPSHGHGDDADEEAHEGFEIEVVGRLPVTGTPWDHAVIVPVESVWETHGLANGHAEDHRIGAPFTPELFPGTPAVVVVPRDMGSGYGLRTTLNQSSDMMAILPGGVQAELYRLMGDARQAVTVLTGMTQGLVVLAVLVSLMILTRLYQRQLAMLRAVGAPGRFVLAVVWGHAAVLLLAGVALGLVLGYGAALGVSALLTARTSVVLPVTLGLPELRLAAGFACGGALAALLPAWWAMRRPVAGSLRGG